MKDADSRRLVVMRDETAVSAVRQALDEAGAAGPLRTLDAEVPTAAAAAESLGCEVGAIANSLVFLADGLPIMVIASGARRVDTGLVAAVLEVSKVRRATPEQVLEATGQRVGGVAPVGHPRQLPTVVDVSLRSFDTVWAGAGDHYSMFATSFAELVKLTGGIEADVQP